MKIPVSWLNDFVALDDVSIKELADKLVNVGFEVEEILYAGEGISNVAVGKILDIKKHPDADKLQVCMVDVSKEITTIVTGAHNISVGDLVPIALDNSTLPGGKTIVSSPLRGVMSYGMMCSGKELNVDNAVIDGAENDGILILPADAEIGQDIKKTLGLNEYILDISVTANRPDCQSVYGMAREVAAVLNRKIKAPSLKYKTTEQAVIIPAVEIEDFALCSRYTGRLITEVNIEQSPKWMRDRLRMAGIRPINNIVDITNYVLIEIGQPLHAFDIKNVKGTIHVRCAVPGEKIMALDGIQYELKNNMLVIADDEKALAIAGVMGGQYSGIMLDTRSVFLEAARFSRGSVRSTSRALGLRSDSSARYERGVDYSSVDVGRERALSLIYQLKAGKIINLATQCEQRAPEAKVIVTKAEQISKLLGIDIKASAIIKILKALCFEVEQKGTDIVCTVPLFREDVDNYTDLTEEVIRYYGYDNINSTFLANAKCTAGGLSEKQKNMNTLKSLLCGFGMYETATYAFINRKQADHLNLKPNSHLRNFIEISNPLSEEYGVMRTQLIGSLLKVIYNNTNRKNDHFRLFEIAKTFHAKNLPLTELPDENETLCFALTGENETFYNLKEIVSDVLKKFNVNYKIDYSSADFLHPGISADILVNGNVIGCYGKIHPSVAKSFSLPQDVFVAEINLEPFISEKPINLQYKALPKFPSVDRDLAVIVKDSYTVGELVQCILQAGGELLESVNLFDVYRGEQIAEGYKSAAFSLKIVSAEKTLKDEEIQNLMNKIIAALSEKFDAKLR